MKLKEITEKGFYTKVNSEESGIIEFYVDDVKGPMIEFWDFYGLDMENNGKKYVISETYCQNNMGDLGEIEVEPTDKKFYEYDGVLYEDKPSYVTLENKLLKIQEELSKVLNQDEYVEEGQLWAAIFEIEKVLKND